MKKIILLLGVGFLNLTAWAQPAPVDIELILDASGSMAALTEGTSQIAIAKKSIQSTITNIPANIAVAFRVYGHRVPKSDKENSCKDTELVIPFGPLNVASFTAKLDGLNPNGYTPIAYSLRTAAQDFLGKESQHVIILVSDGEETCGGDPVAEAKNLLAQGFKVTIHTIGFRVDANTKAQLTAISNATGGSYFDAKDAASLTQNLTQATQKALVIAKPAEAARGQEIRGGNQYADALLLEEGIEYRLDHHQKQNQFDYFYLPLQKGQSMTVTITTQDQGVDIYKAVSGLEEVRENTRPYAGVRIVGPAPDYQQIDDKVVISAQHGKKMAGAIALQAGDYYLLVGNSYNAQHKNSPFKIEINEHYDANTNRDAGDDVVQATPIVPGDYPTNWLLVERDQDVYRVEAQADDAYTIKIAPPDLEAWLQAQVLDQDRIRMANLYSPNRGAVLRFENIHLKAMGPFYIQVTGYLTNRYPLAYALSVQKSSGAMGIEQPTAPVPTTAAGVPITTTGAPTPAPAKGTVSKGNSLLYLLLGLAALIIVGLGAVIWLLLKRRK